MPGYKEVLESIRHNGSASAVCQDLKIAPSRLRQILRCKRLRRQLELDAQIAEVAVLTRATNYAGVAMTALVDLTIGHQEESARKASMAVINQALGRAPVTPGAIAEANREPGDGTVTNRAGAC